MAKESFLELKGKVTELLPSATFRVLIEKNNHEVFAHTAGKLRKHRIRILVGDSVLLQLSHYDLSRGRIIFRY